MFFDSLHEKGYTFNGDAPITGLHRQEIAQLQLAHLIELDQRQKRRDQVEHSDRPDSFGDVSESRAQAFQ